MFKWAALCIVVALGIFNVAAAQPVKAIIVATVLSKGKSQLLQNSLRKANVGRKRQKVADFLGVCLRLK